MPDNATDEQLLMLEVKKVIKQATSASMADDMWHTWEERIAICMIDGGLKLVDAMRVALDQIKEMSACSTA